MAAVQSIPPLPDGARPIPGFPHYCVTATGVVFSCKVYGSKARRLGPWWVMKPKMRKRVGYKGGYRYVDLFREVGKPVRHYIHHLVLEVFVGPRPEGSQGRHLDDDRLNNVPSNLAWGTRQDNATDAVRNGRTARGEANGASKLTAAVVREMRRLRTEGAKLRDLANRFGTSIQLACAVCLRKTWKYLN